MVLYGLSIGCYGVIIISWMMILSKAEVSFAYAFSSFGLVTIQGVLFLREHVSIQRIADDTKSKLPDQIGFRGIGRLSAFPYCKQLTFFNKPKGSKNIMVFEWDGTEFKNLLITNQILI
jgi:hypothetical protein